MGTLFIRSVAPDRYTLLHLEDGGGSPLAVDAAEPSAVEPAANRCHRAPFGYQSTGMRIYALDAGTITVQPWVYDDGRGLWLRFAGSTALNNVSVSQNAPGALMAGAKFFYRIVANTTVTKFGWSFN